MKRLLALILACLFIVSSLAACGNNNSDEKKEEIKGAEIQMFLTTLPESIDPSASYTTVDHIRIMRIGIFPCSRRTSKSVRHGR